jgi:UDP-glucose 4-epimerase
MSKLVIFGADGFIGRHLVGELAADKDNSITAFDRFGSYVIGSDHPFEELKNVKVAPGNFFNREDVTAAIAGADYVFHLISTTNPATSIHDPFIDIDTNLRGSVELFSLCAEAGVKRVIFLSSGGTVYGDINSESIDETTLPAPQSPYAIGKLAIEHYLRYFKSTHELDYIVFRVANPYGPGQNIMGKQGVVPIFMHKVLEKEPLTIFGDGEMVRDYFYINDLAKLIAGSYHQPHRHDTYNLGSGTGTTVNRLVEAIEKCAGYPVEKHSEPTPATYVHKSVLNIDRFVNEFQIKPTTSLEEGLKKTWEHVRSHE